MKKLQSLMPKLRIKSLYIKWLLLFTGLIITAQITTLGFAFRYIIPEVESNLASRLYNKAIFVRDLYNKGFEITERTLSETGDNDINFYLFSNDAIPEDIGKYSDLISLNMLHRASEGEIVISYTKDRTKMPFYLFAVGKQIALVSPNLHGNELTLFMRGINRSVFSGAVIGSIFIVVALIIIIRPIKKVTQATREVAKGNFNVSLKTGSVDEIGQLINNFNAMTKELQKNEYLKKDFVSSVSHEFKTPITSIEGFAKLLKNNSLTEHEFNEYTDIIIKETSRLSNLSSNLLKLSLLDSSEFEPVKNRFYLDEQIREVILLLQSKWEEKNIDFEIDMDEISFYGSEELLLQVWINLIDNAIKFSPAGGKITITSTRENQKINISVADQGIGIPSEHGEKIFDRFYKADKSRSKEGNGLGLSIVKRILEMSKGSITFHRQAVKGTCFIVTLPDTASGQA